MSFVCYNSMQKSNHLIGGPAHDWNEEDVDKLDDITEEEQMRDLDNGHDDNYKWG